MSSNVKTAVFWVVIVCAVVLVYLAVKSGRGTAPQELSVSDFVTYVQDGKVKEAKIIGTDVQRRRRRRRGQGRAPGDYRVPSRAAEIPEAGRPHSEGSASHWAPGYRKDPACPCDRGRGERSVFLDFRF